MIDLHMHSKASDGTDDIDELLEKVRSAGIDIFAVTDHDTIEGAMEMEYIVPADMTFIRGIEFSCISEAGKCHILGYGFDWNKRSFRNALEEGNRRRRNKLERRLSFLKDEFDIDFSEEELAHLRIKNSVGKPHLGNMLVQKGYATDKNEAIEKFIEPCKTESDRLDAVVVIKAIIEADGIPVWAHPLGGTREKEVSETAFWKQLEILADAGLGGLECYYSKYSRKQVEFLLDAAKKNNLYLSGGSDYHGINKPIRLGELHAYGDTIDNRQLTVVDAIREKERLRKDHLLEIVEGHDPGAYFWIMPVRVIDITSRTDVMDNQEVMRDQQISIEEDIVRDFLYPIFKRHFDNDLPENAGRDDEYLPEHYKSGIAFEWNLTDNFYTLDSIKKMLADICDIARLLREKPEDEALNVIRDGLNELGHYIPHRGGFRVTEDDSDIEIRCRDNMPELIDFYGRFCDYMETMLKAAEDNGYRLISICGP